MSRSEHKLSFSTASFSEQGSFKLLELPSDLCKLVEESIEGLTTLSFTVKGQSSEDAVLCTNDRTYSIRSITLSNSILVVTPPSDTSLDAWLEDDTVVIRDQVNEVLELTPIVPKLHKLSAFLRDKEYGEDQEDEDMDEERGDASKKFTYEDARKMIQASEAELDRGLRDRHILQIHGELRPIAPAYLSRIIELILNSLVSLSLPHEAAHVDILSTALADEHEIPRSVSTQVMCWFGEIRDGRWAMNVNSVIKEAGISILRLHKHDPIDKDELVTSWKYLVGDKFSSSVSLDLLAGNFLVSPSRHGAAQVSLTYFPASLLPNDPAQRFADLFLTRSRWKSEDIEPFLSDIAIDSKERDKLLLKYARALTDAQGVWYTARAQYSI